VSSRYYFFAQLDGPKTDQRQTNRTQEYIAGTRVDTRMYLLFVNSTYIPS
jgi:hypothetical protein